MLLFLFSFFLLIGSDCEEMNLVWDHDEWEKPQEKLDI